MPIQVTCAACGTEFAVKPSRLASGRGKFCSPECAAGAKPRQPLADRLATRIDRTGGEDACQPYTGYRDRHGYGRIGEGGRTSQGGRMLLAHRAAIGLACCWPPDDVDVCHSCDNPPCCNPRHLWYGDQAANNRDMGAKGRARHGEAHPWTRLTEAERAQIFALREQGLSHRQIAARIGCSHRHVGNILTGRRRPLRP